MLNNGLIYVATNKVNGKQYVGLTIRALKDRWNQHCSVARKCAKTYLHRAIVKYGPEQFDVQEFAYAQSRSVLGDLERDVILQLAPEYNQTNGGEVTFGRKYDDATKERIRIANTGKTRTESQRRQMSALKKQQYHDRPELKAATTQRLAIERDKPENRAKQKAAVSAASKGRAWSTESRAKLSASTKGRRYGPDIIAKIAATKSKRIYCSDGRVFDNRVEAAKQTGVSTKTIWRWCKGKTTRSNNGLIFSYEVIK